MSEFNTVEANMRKRRKEATSVLGEHQALCTITSFPRSVPLSACSCYSSRNIRLEVLGSARDSSQPIRSPHCWTAEHCHHFKELLHNRVTPQPPPNLVLATFTANQAVCGPWAVGWICLLTLIHSCYRAAVKMHSIFSWWLGCALVRAHTWTGLECPCDWGLVSSVGRV